MDKPALSLIVPMYNEAPNLPDLVRCTTDALNATGLGWELILVDDGSTDNTAEQVRTLMANEPRIVLVCHPERQGKTSAYRSGFQKAQGDYWFTIDADLQENPNAISEMLKMLGADWDMVVAWRRVRHDPLGKRIASHIFNATLRWVFGSPVHDLNCGFKGMRRAVGEALLPWLVRDFHRHLPLIAHRLGYRVGEREVEHRPRLRGRSRYGLERYGRALSDLCVLWRALKQGKPPRR